MDCHRPKNCEESSLQVTEPQRVREIAPSRGRTMKEYEEKLSQLKKENFRLKLRIYFLEEGSKKNAFNGKESPEALIKYEELKNEAESIRNELNEKQSLLFDAMLALDAMEEKLAEEQRQRHAQVAVLEERIMQLDKELELSPARCPRSPRALSDYEFSTPVSKTNSNEALSPISPRAFVTVAAHVRDLQEQVRIISQDQIDNVIVDKRLDTTLKTRKRKVDSLESALRDESATTNRLRDQLKMEKEIRSRQDEEIALRFQNSEDQAATILQLTIDLQRQRDRCAELQESLAQKEKLRFQLEDALRDREERLEELQAELQGIRSVDVNVQVADKLTCTRSIPCLSVSCSQHSLGSRNSQRYELPALNDAAAELSRLRIDYNLALQNMARFLRRSRMQQAALERAERRELQLLEEIRELRAMCSAAKSDLGCIKDQLSPSVRSSKLAFSTDDMPDVDSGDYVPTSQRSRSEVVRPAPSLLSWVLQSLSQNPEESQYHNVQTEEEHLRQMQLVGILALLSRMVTVVNNATNINPEDRQTLQNLTEAAILLCSSTSDLLPPKQLDFNPDSAVTNLQASSWKSRSQMNLSREMESPGYGNDCVKDKITTVQLSKVAEEGPDVAIRFKVQVVSQSETCVAHEEETRPSLLEEARLLCEKLETPFKSKDEFPEKHITMEENVLQVPKMVRNVATQALARPHNFHLSNSDIENPLQGENMKLRSLLRKSRRVLEHTYSQLAAANERKRVVEDVMGNRQSGTTPTKA